jgi:23S rRNA pseudouridine1911/1915/1917 synthase
MRTLLDALQALFPESSKTTLRQMLQNDRVRVNGAPERDAKRELRDDEHVSIADRNERVDPRVKILYEDADVIVVDKAVGLLTVPSETVRHETVESFLNHYLGAAIGETRVYHAHRLDRDTSGVLVFAKNTHVREKLQAQFAEHKPGRVYVAIVRGKMKERTGTFRSYLAEERDLRVRVVPTAREGKEAVSHYRVIASGKRWTLVEVTLETGRRNQIRVQFAAAGHPVVGDTMYGNGKEDGFGRLALHAKTLSFTHPKTGKVLSFTADEPKTFKEAKL